MGVVFLAHSKETAVPEFRALIIACADCKNKTYKLLMDESVSPYPMVQCAACDAHIGHVGWVS